MQKEESKAPQQAAPAPPPPPPAPKPEPVPAPKPQLPKQELPKPASTKKYEEEMKGNKDGQRNKRDAKKGRKKKSNGFKLFGSQMLMLGAFAGGAYALLFRGELLSGWMEKADKAILNATSK